VLGSYSEIRLYQLHCGYSAKTYYHFGSDQLYLLTEKRHTARLLCRQRITVAGRTALDYIGYVHILAGYIHRLKISVKELTCGTYEGYPLFILLGTRGFTHEHQISLSVAGAEYQIRPRVPQRTRVTGTGGTLKLFPGHNGSPFLQDT